ncbi:hypothetical protein AAC03nite_20550 [Alicyclobacillus acidoterrestris]|nr:hypothetical protein AAC03nite_20550 [Alicyclobacillus acidoterrestris]
MDRIKEALEKARPEWEAVLKHQKGSRANESHKENNDKTSIPQRDGGAVDA